MPSSNALLVRWNGGWIERTDSTSIGANGRHEGTLALGALRSLVETERVADGQLAMFADPRAQVTGGIEPALDAEIPYLAFLTGDRASMPAADLTPTSQRVVSISVSEDTEGNPVFVPEFQDVINARRLAINNNIKKMSNGTLTGRSVVGTPISQIENQGTPTCCPPVAAPVGIGPLSDTSAYTWDGANDYPDARMLFPSFEPIYVIAYRDAGTGHGFVRGVTLPPPSRAAVISATAYDLGPVPSPARFSISNFDGATNFCVRYSSGGGSAMRPFTFNGTDVDNNVTFNMGDPVTVAGSNAQTNPIMATHGSSPDSYVFTWGDGGSSVERWDFDGFVTPVLSNHTTVGTAPAAGATATSPLIPGSPDDPGIVGAGWFDGSQSYWCPATIDGATGSVTFGTVTTVTVAGFPRSFWVQSSTGAYLVRVQGDVFFIQLDPTTFTWDGNLYPSGDEHLLGYAGWSGTDVFYGPFYGSTPDAVNFQTGTAGPPFVMDGPTTCTADAPDASPHPVPGVPEGAVIDGLDGGPLSIVVMSGRVIAVGINCS